MPIRVRERVVGVALGMLLALGGLSCSDGSGDGGSRSSGDGPPAGIERGHASPSTSTPRRAFTVAGSGDILLHAAVISRGLANGGGTVHDFKPMFSEVKDEISSADLAICHQETPISATNKNLAGYPVFNSPREIADALADAGFDGCDTASNHSIDKGYEGVKSTGDVLDAAGLGHTGSFRTADEARDGGGVIYDAKGVKVGHLAYTYGTNGMPIPADKTWLLNLNDPTEMLAHARALKARGAEVVVMSVHWGAEYQVQPTPDQRSLAHQLLASPAVDLILGDHVHVVQPMEKIGGKYVIYGMGNFLSNQSPSSASSLIAATQDGALYTFSFEEKPDGGFQAVRAVFTPTFVRRPDYRIIKASPTVEPSSFQRTVKAIFLLGAGATDATATTGPIPPDAVPPTTTTPTRTPASAKKT